MVSAVDQFPGLRFSHRPQGLGVRFAAFEAMAPCHG